MRKILLTALLAAGGLTASAQYLPNGDFKQWKTTCGKSDQTSFNGAFPYSPVGLKNRPGVEPEDWNGSNVNQTVIANKKEPGLVTKGSENFVRLQNKFVGVSSYGSNAPAFINFATPWGLCSKKY